MRGYNINFSFAGYNGITYARYLPRVFFASDRIEILRNFYRNDSVIYKVQTMDTAEKLREYRGNAKHHWTLRRVLAGRPLSVIFSGDDKSSGQRASAFGEFRNLFFLRKIGIQRNKRPVCNRLKVGTRRHPT